MAENKIVNADKLQGLKSCERQEFRFRFQEDRDGHSVGKHLRIRTTTKTQIPTSVSCAASGIKL